jgi:uncharacterized membrane protein YkgB
MFESAFSGGPFGRSFGRISPQSQDILASKLVSFLQKKKKEYKDQYFERGKWKGGDIEWYFESVVDFLSGHVGASEMHACLEAELLVGSLDELGGQVGGGPACAPCDIYKDRAQL